MAATAEQLFARTDDGMRHELVRGELLTMTPPGFEHGLVASRIGELLRDHVKANALGVAITSEVGFTLERDPDTVRAPDVSFVAQARLEALGSIRRYWPEAPALAVEVLSPSDSLEAVEAKALDWLAGGSVAVLVLDPARRSGTIYRAGGEAHVHLGDAVLELDDAVPGLRVALADLFAS